MHGENSGDYFLIFRPRFVHLFLHRLLRSTSCWDCGQGIVRPVVFWVASAHFFFNLVVAAGPEPGQVLRHLDRAPGRRQQLHQQWLAAAGDPGSLRAPEHLLQANGQNRGFPRVVYSDARSGGNFDVRGRPFIEPAALLPGEQAAERSAEVCLFQAADPSDPADVRGQPFLQGIGQRRIGNIRPAAFIPAHPFEKTHPLLPVPKTGRPGQAADAGLADAFDQGRGNARRVCMLERFGFQGQGAQAKGPLQLDGRRAFVPGDGFADLQDLAEILQNRSRLAGCGQTRASRRSPSSSAATM